MTLDLLAALLASLTVLAGLALFLQKKLLHSVVFLALAAVGSSLIFLYLGQVLVALLQLFIFVGGLSTYLIVAVATEEKQVKMRNAAAFVIISAITSVGLFAAVSNTTVPGLAGNDFSTVAQGAISNYYAFIFAAVFLLFAAALGSVIIIKKFTRLVV
ncbi:MAG: NADH-quinone oxidoreductase subunit J [Candidatus Micrarchaeota archaeon]|nr:NADH-quinone oxidoreductase subunit J [Candidatus Micrarchaeota archaeon]